MTFFGAKNRADSADGHNSKNLMNKPYSESTLVAMSKGYGFTQSETDIVRFAAAALPLPEIATAMDLPVESVKSKMRSICKKTGTYGEAGARDLVERIMS